MFSECVHWLVNVSWKDYRKKTWVKSRGWGVVGPVLKHLWFSLGKLWLLKWWKWRGSGQKGTPSVRITLSKVFKIRNVLQINCTYMYIGNIDVNIIWIWIFYNLCKKYQLLTLAIFFCMILHIGYPYCIDNPPIASWIFRFCRSIVHVSEMSILLKVWFFYSLCKKYQLLNLDIFGFCIILHRE